MSELTLVTKKGSYQVPAVKHETVVKIAKQHKIPWGYACERGICAQCRTRVEEGAEFLNEVTEAEKLRLRKAERSENYRLGCQIKLIGEGNVTLVHQPY